MKTIEELMEEILEGLPSDISQRQDALNDQLKDLWRIANKLKMYDAADFIRERIHSYRYGTAGK